LPRPSAWGRGQGRLQRFVPDTSPRGKPRSLAGDRWFRLSARIGAPLNFRFLNRRASGPSLREFDQSSSHARRFNYFFTASRTTSFRPPIVFCTFPSALSALPSFFSLESATT